MGSQRLVGRKTLLKKRVPEHQEPLLMLRLSPTPAFGPKQTLPVAGTQRLAKRGIGRQPNQRLLIDQGCFIPHRTAGARLSRRRLRMHPIELRLGQGPSQPAKRVEHIMPAAMTAHSCGHLRMLIDLRQQFPALRIVFEHITTQEAAEFVRDAEGPIAATITPQHLLYNRNAIFSGGLRPHWYCLPVLKKERHRLALLAAATSGSPKFFLGTDSAPHATHLKEHAAACAGCYSAPHALALYASAFEAANALAAFPGFAAAHGAAFYGLDAHRRKIRLVKSACEIPERMAFGSGQHIVPLAAGEMLPWRF
ncbi:MAG: dihydroorotase, partial [Betaproteobacteria bacterium]|nr:dihydroorotase [Betaproteobacteria bacterium]